MRAFVSMHAAKGNCCSSGMPCLELACKLTMTCNYWGTHFVM